MSIVTTLASLVHALLVLVKPGVWEAIFGKEIPVPSPDRVPPRILNLQWMSPLLHTGGVNSAVAIIVCNMSVIIPAMLRALGVGDPFMQEDSVDPNFSTIEMARTASTRVEFGLPTTRGTAITDSDESEGTVGAAVSLQQHTVNLDVKIDRTHQLTMHASNGSLRSSSTTKVGPLTDESSIADALAQVRSPPVKERQSIEVDVKDKSNGA